MLQDKGDTKLLDPTIDHSERLMRINVPKTIPVDMAYTTAEISIIGAQL